MNKERLLLEKQLSDLTKVGFDNCLFSGQAFFINCFMYLMDVLCRCLCSQDAEIHGRSEVVIWKV